MEDRSMKTFLLLGAALAAAVISRALAQPEAQDHPAMAMQPMTRAEVIQRVQEHFAMLDTNQDGFVTQAEMDAAKGAMHGKMMQHREQRGDAMFDRMDANHDGSISRSEFDAAHQAMAARIGDNGHRMGMGLSMMHGASMGAHLFAMADADKDGRVSLQEATNAAAAHFDQADANHDGTLTPDEMRAAHKAMGDRHGG
jgi:Ca2+-binding EF-hand superfamily protein